MSPQQLSLSSNEDPRYANMDERKRKRMMSNRESARRSRKRKEQQHLDELSSQITKLQSENSQIVQKINSGSQLYIAVESENNVLRAQLMELTDRLRSLNSVLQIVEEVSGLAMEIPMIPDALMEPWQLPCSVPPITATSDVLQL